MQKEHVMIIKRWTISRPNQEALETVSNAEAKEFVDRKECTYMLRIFPIHGLKTLSCCLIAKTIIHI